MRHPLMNLVNTTLSQIYGDPKLNVSIYGSVLNSILYIAVVWYCINCWWWAICRCKFHGIISPFMGFLKVSFGLGLNQRNFSYTLQKSEKSLFGMHYGLYNLTFNTQCCTFYQAFLQAQNQQPAHQKVFESCGQLSKSRQKQQNSDFY